MDPSSAALLESANASLRIVNPVQLTAADAIQLAKRLQQRGLFGHASNVLRATLEHTSTADPLRTRLIQQLVISTYKDRTEPRFERLEHAIALLAELAIDTTRDQETLGIAGAIYKRKWELTTQTADLRRSLHYYRRGEREGVEADDGYTAINAAFVARLLSTRLRDEADDGDAAAGPRSDASEPAQLETYAAALYTRIINACPARLDAAAAVESWWQRATLVEAYFATGRYAEAAQYLDPEVVARVDRWKVESLLRQLGALSQIRKTSTISAGSVADDDAIASAFLRTHFGDRIESLIDGIGSRVGLALSGGGFRASLFHLGVFARLAEMDVLRHVEVLSCVSGGSIIGAHYFLAVRELLQRKEDGAITRDDYVKIVRDAIDVFSRGIQTNLRVQSLASFLVNLRVLWDPEYTRTERVAELYDEHFFNAAPGSSGKRLLMRELTICPAGTANDFLPERDNWARLNRVPLLVLNATALNTGHNWQFTPGWMGESRAYINNETEATYHLRRMMYEEAPGGHRDLPLSRAVAASSCVPALFPPVRLMSLYDDKLVALVDGAIHDNQGVATLLAEDCTACIVSDGAGHMAAVDRPGLGALGVGMRCNSILQTRLREAQYRELAALERASALSRVAVHLKKDLVGEMIAWIGCDTRPPGLFPRAHHLSMTGYSVSRDLQQRIALVRTDLDAFSDLEMQALMLDGYRMAEKYVGTLRGVPAGIVQSEPWSFFSVDPALRGGDGAERLARSLTVGSRVFGKLFHLSKAASNALRYATIGVVAIILAMLARLTWLAMHDRWNVVTAYLRAVGTPIVWLTTLYASVVLAALMFHRTRRWLKPGIESPSAGQVALDLLVFLFGWLPARLYLAFGNPLYLKAGRLEKRE